MNETEEVTKECPRPGEMNFIEHAEMWLRSIPEEDANRFLYGLNMDSVLILFKYFPDENIVKQLLQVRI